MYTTEEYDEFSKSMKTKYPKMFSGRYGGFCVDKGWWHILEVLCHQIQSHIDWKNKNGSTVPQVVVDQIKEKFGGLRFYYHGGDDYVFGLVCMAESWACVTCETCGERGKRRDGGWMKTLCDKHEEERQERMKRDDY